MTDVYSHYTAGPTRRKSALEKFGDKLDRIAVQRPKSLAEAIAREAWTVPATEVTELAEKVAAAKTEAELRKAANALAVAETANASLSSETVKYAVSRAIVAAKEDLYADVPDLLSTIEEKFLTMADQFTEQYARFPSDLEEPFYRFTAEQGEALRLAHDYAAQLIELADVFVTAHNLSGGTFEPIRLMGNAQGSLLAALVFGDYGNEYPGTKANRAATEIQRHKGRQTGKLAPYQPFAAVLNNGGSLTLKTAREAEAYRTDIFTTD